MERIKLVLSVFLLMVGALIAYNFSFRTVYLKTFNPSATTTGSLNPQSIYGSSAGPGISPIYIVGGLVLIALIALTTAVFHISYHRRKHSKHKR